MFIAGFVCGVLAAVVSAAGVIAFAVIALLGRFSKEFDW